MNRRIRHVAVFVGLFMFLPLLANATYLALARSNSLLNNPQNSRVRDAQYARDRGAILVGNTAIASSVASKGQFKFQRTYANGPLYAPITGYYSYYGRTGLEQAENAELAGTSDSQFLTRVMDSFSGRTPQGASVLTTINAKAQQAAYDALGSQSGAAVAINYRTGAILAMVSKPSYDPNQLANNDLQAAAAASKQLNADSNNPLSNRATKEIYPPGSTFKLVTAAAALENGMSPDTEVAAPASLTLPGTRTQLPNEGDCGGTKITMTQALVVSCNTAFANIGLELGQDKLRAQAKKFGFDSNFDLTGGNGFTTATSQFPATLNQAQLAQSSIGQYDVAASPMQMALVAGAIANDGVAMKPYLVQEVRSHTLQVLSSASPQQLGQAMSADNAKKLQTMMEKVVTDGTGQPAQVSGVTVGGKTGTAQSDPNRPPYAWFVGFAQSPDVVVAVMIDKANVSRTDIAGGRLAGPVFAAVVEALR